MNKAMFFTFALAALAGQSMAQSTSQYEFFGRGRCADSQEQLYEYWHLEGGKAKNLRYKHDISECKCDECEPTCATTNGCIGFEYQCCREGVRCSAGASLLFRKGTKPQWNPPGNWSNVGPHGSATSVSYLNGVGPISTLRSSEPGRFCVRQSPASDDGALIEEWNDVRMGVAFTMVGENGWRSGNWGVVPTPLTEYTNWAQTFISIMTRDQPMAVYRRRPYGLALHVTRESNFWKDFQVIGHGRDRIVGGPGDGGSNTHPSADWRLSMESQGKSYEWFTSQKNAILAKYNTVYGNHDYNEFITNGMRASAIAGILFWERSSKWDQQKVSDAELCSFLKQNAPGRLTPWPVYGYTYGELKIIRHLSCGGLATGETIHV
mmetsp:Transcript_49713/g.93096  ORF Transcript_49713/g.93096 Transcript_49713/m.93096 type:complete len:378 (-) Transcript_49713:350-1483(-)